VFSWGSGYGGRLGQGHLRDRFTPLRIAALHGKDVYELACNDLHSAAVCSKFTVENVHDCRVIKSFPVGFFY